jgi:hypothetical protein
VSRIKRKGKDLIKKDENNNLKFELALDMADFELEEIKITTYVHSLKISAIRDKKVTTFL